MTVVFFWIILCIDSSFGYNNLEYQKDQVGSLIFEGHSILAATHFLSPKIVYWGQQKFKDQ